MSTIRCASSLVGTSVEPDGGGRCVSFSVPFYDLGQTLSSGQAFRWEPLEEGWEGVVQDRWVRLTSKPGGIAAETMSAPASWIWLTDYLQLNVDLTAVIRQFPDDEPMRLAVQSCRGLRLLRQDPWECLASFILSSTKQIVQIQQIVRTLCERFGQSVAVPPGRRPAYSFPSAETLAQVPESELRECKMGFRAPHLRAAAMAVAGRTLDLNALRIRRWEEAKNELTKLRGVGPKIANCVLLFAYGFQDAFPVDVWVSRALKDLYFPNKRKHPKQLERFAQTHFGPFAGYAQQYLFHYVRMRKRATSNPLPSPELQPRS